MNEEIPRGICGVYRLEWDDVRYFYFGCSIDIADRYFAHKSDLERGDHINRTLQLLYAKHGLPKISIANIFKTLEAAQIREKELIHKNRNHPYCCNREAINIHRLEKDLLIDVPVEFHTLFDLLPPQQLSDFYRFNRSYTEEDLRDIIEKKRGKSGALKEVFSRLINPAIKRIIKDAMEKERDYLKEIRLPYSGMIALVHHPKPKHLVLRWHFYKPVLRPNFIIMESLCHQTFSNG